MAKKPKESHRAYKEWASSINYYNKILLELYIQKINGRATELCLAHTLKFVPQVSSAGSGNSNRQLQMVARDPASVQVDMWACLTFMEISLPSPPPFP